MIRRTRCTVRNDKLDNPGEDNPLLLPVLVAGVLAAITGVWLISALLGLMLTAVD